MSAFELCLTCFVLVLLLTFFLEGEVGGVGILIKLFLSVFACKSKVFDFEPFAADEVDVVDLVLFLLPVEEAELDLFKSTGLAVPFNAVAEAPV